MPRRGMIVVSPTQSVPEVPAVWEDESWSWAYTATEPKTYTRTLNEESSAEDLTFRFSNMPKTNVPQHAEDVKVNTIKL